MCRYTECSNVNFQHLLLASACCKICKQTTVGYINDADEQFCLGNAYCARIFGRPDVMYRWLSDHPTTADFEGLERRSEARNAFLDEADPTEEVEAQARRWLADSHGVDEKLLEDLRTHVDLFSPRRRVWAFILRFVPVLVLYILQHCRTFTVE